MVLDKSAGNRLCNFAKIIFPGFFFFFPVCTDGVNISPQKMEVVAKWTAWPCDDCNTREACKMYAAFKAVALDK